MKVIKLYHCFKKDNKTVCVKDYAIVVNDYVFLIDFKFKNNECFKSFDKHLEVYDGELFKVLRKLSPTTYKKFKEDYKLD